MDGKTYKVLPKEDIVKNASVKGTKNTMRQKTKNYEKTLLYKIANDVLLPIGSIVKIINSAPRRYKVYTIPKLSGKGTRTIAQPAKEVKLLQYWIISNIFPKLPIHSAATAYIKGKNIADNANPHAQKGYILKLDFKDYFPSITGDDFIKYMKDTRGFDYNDNDLNRLRNILFWLPKYENKYRLSIGAPSSPYFSNAIMFQFDKLVYEYCMNKNITYTRYADDITFSMVDGKKRSEALEQIKYILAKLPYPRLKLNVKKTVIVSKIQSANCYRLGPFKRRKSFNRSR